MFRRLKKIINVAKQQVLQSDKNQSKNQPIQENIPTSLADVKAKLLATFKDDSDLVIRELVLGEGAKLKVFVVYIHGMVNKALISEAIINPMLIHAKEASIDKELKNKDVVRIFQEKILTASEITVMIDFREALEHILVGDALIFMDGSPRAITACAQGGERRSVTEPDTESLVRGPREGFTEELRVNTALLRHRIKSTKLKFETLQVGKYTKTMVSICYIKGIVNKDIVETVKRRIRAINIDGVLDSGYIEQFIEDAPLSLFPTVGNSERPDKVAGKLLEGRVAILCDGSPIVLIVPYLFVETLQITEDYYMRTFFATFNRVLRVLALMIALTLPAIYVAVLVHHFNIIPFKLLLSMAATREGIPFEPLTEAFFMLIVFEILREAGIRMPKPVGQTVSIVAGLIIGEGAVAAGLVSPIMVIVIAITGICTFLVTPLQDVLPMLRLLLLMGAYILGFLGLYLGLIFILVHLCSLRSFGVPYTTPFSPSNMSDLKDTLVRPPLWSMVRRPWDLITKENPTAKHRMDGHYPKKED